MGVNRIAAAGFGQAAAEYERARPSYPDDAVASIAAMTPVGGRVLDLACGTGKLTRLLAAAGLDVMGADPVDAMVRQMPDRVTGSAPVAECAAEAMCFAGASFDLVTVAQAFHWFDGTAALAEIHRVLRPEGGLALVWNVRDERSGWVGALNEIFGRYERDVATLRFWRGAWKAAFDSTDLFTPLERRDFAYEQRLTREAMLERVASVSFIATLPESQRRRVASEVEGILEADPLTAGKDEIVMPYRTQLYTCRRIG